MLMSEPSEKTFADLLRKLGEDDDDEVLHSEDIEEVEISTKKARLSRLPTPPPNLPASMSPNTPEAAHQLITDEPGPSSIADLPKELGRYRLISEVARGGNGRVIRALDVELGREVAIKLLLPGFSQNRIAVKRFVTEARINARLDHPNIVPVHDIGVLPGNEPFFVMKFVRGRALSQVFGGLRRGEPDIVREFSRLRLLQLFQKLCMGVAFCHAKGILHRDLKPSNVMIGEFGEVHLMDWGLAKIRGANQDAYMQSSQADDAQLSIEGRVFGTPLYMAPEQAQGYHHEIDERSDIYALGAILYEVLTYQTTYALKGVEEVLRAVILEPVIAPRLRAPARDIPELLEEICLRALSKNKLERYPSARALHDEIEAFLEGTKDRDKKEREAESKVEEGKARLLEHKRREQIIRDLSLQRDLWRRTISPSASEEEKQPLWDLERRLAEGRGDELRAFGKAIDAFQQALGFVQNHAEARTHLAALYASRLKQADTERNVERATHYAAQVRRYDDGRYAALLEGTAHLELKTKPENVKVYAQSILSREVVATLGAPSFLGTTPLSVALKFGEYLLEFEAAGLLRAKAPVWLGRNETLSLQLPMLRPSQLPEGFIYIPAGPTWLGGDSLAPAASIWRQEHVHGFAIAKFPVQMGEYLAFLNALAEKDHEEAERRAPRATANAGHYWRRGLDGTYAMPTSDPDGDVHQPSFPIVAVSFEDALAYCAWRRSLDGIDYRLLTESEWEKAGRGTDGRLFPWGDMFDPAFCKMRDSGSKRNLCPVGTFSRDVSPYGVHDMAGLVAEWCDGWFDETVGLRPIRGGGWLHPEQNCRLAARSGDRPHVVSGARGFRLAISLERDATAAPE
jgi:eukaryotic-like serine/threonine-protein kinase